MKNTWTFAEKPGKIMEFCQSGKVGILCNAAGDAIIKWTKYDTNKNYLESRLIKIS